MLHDNVPLSDVLELCLPQVPELLLNRLSHLDHVLCCSLVLDLDQRHLKLRLDFFVRSTSQLRSVEAANNELVGKVRVDALAFLTKGMTSPEDLEDEFPGAFEFWNQW